MKTLRILGVPEHFNFPFRLLEQEQPFADRGVKIQWTDESRGSGQMNLALRNDETDIAILLTESFLKDFESGNPSKMIGFHVSTPLIWGIHVRAGSAVQSPADLVEKRILVSRMGSGSHLMAMVLARREGWDNGELTFETIGNMDGAKAAMDSGDEGIFLWEKYTTAPMVDNGTMKRIDEIPSPWPCFAIVASQKALEEFGDFIFDLRDSVYEISRSLVTTPNLAEALASFYKLEVGDVERWLEQTRWCNEPKVSKSELERAVETMLSLGILSKNLSIESFLVDDRLTIEV